MSLVLELLALQGLDDETAALRAALADVESRLQGDAELDEARRRAIQVESRWSIVAAEQGHLEEEIERLNERITVEEKRLYDGSVRNAKELANIQHEVELFKASRARLEDDLVAVLDRAEATERERSEADAAVRQLEGRRTHDLEGLRHEARRLEDSATRTEQKRLLQAARVQPRALQAYEDLRRRKGGVAVVKIQGSACGGCRIGIPEMLRKRALAGEALVHCPNCERILYVG
jgi:predicted  nucleic acid-binding Zn-ribbon protein